MPAHLPEKIEPTKEIFMGSRELVEVAVFLHTETEKAWLISEAEHTDKIWIPKSQAELEVSVRSHGHLQVAVLTLPEWLAMEKDLI